MTRRIFPLLALVASLAIAIAWAVSPLASLIIVAPAAIWAIDNVLKATIPTGDVEHKASALAEFPPPLTGKPHLSSFA